MLIPERPSKNRQSDHYKKEMLFFPLHERYQNGAGAFQVTARRSWTVREAISLHGTEGDERSKGLRKREARAQMRMHNKIS